MRMTAAAIPVSSPPPAPRFRNAGEWLAAFGNIPPERIIFDPPPGTATIDDLIRLAGGNANRAVELVSGTLVEKPMGLRESIIAGLLITLLNNWARPRKLGVVSGEAGTIRLANDTSPREPRPDPPTDPR